MYLGMHKMQTLLPHWSTFLSSSNAYIFNTGEILRLVWHGSQRRNLPVTSTTLLLELRLRNSFPFLNEAARQPKERRGLSFHRQFLADTMHQPELTRPIGGANFILPILNGVMHVPPAISATRVTLEENQPLDIPILLLIFTLEVLMDGK